MTTPTPPDFRALCAELADAYLRLLEHVNYSTWLGYEPSDDLLIIRARAALEAQPEPVEPVETELDERFDWWWHNEGSGMAPLPEEDQEAHVHRISRIAWHNGAYVARWGRPAALPVGATDEELIRVYQAAHQPAWERGEWYGCHVDGLRAVLARWGRPAALPVGPTDEELWKAWEMPEYEALSKEDTINQIRAVLARWGRPAIEPIPVSERLPGAEDCDAEERCWWWIVDDPGQFPYWICAPVSASGWAGYTHWLPFQSLPIPRSEEVLSDG